MSYSERVRGQGVPFIRIRRITGYLVGDFKRFNTAKREEVYDRVPHKTQILFVEEHTDQECSV